MQTMRSRKKKELQVRTRVQGRSAASGVPWWTLPLVLGLTFLVYCPTLRFGFVYDDLLDILNNGSIQSWEAMSGFLFPRSSNIFGPTGWHGARFYRPVFMLWLRLNHAFFGFTPSYWHLAAVLAHLLATLLVYRLVLRLTEDWRPAVVAGLFFGVHPIHIQVACWLSVVSESLLCAALLASLLLYLARERGGDRYAASLLVFAGALLIKETSVVFPALIFAYAWLYTARELPWLRRIAKTLRESLPYVGLSLGYLAMRFAVLKTVAVSVSKLSSGPTFATVPSLLVFYVRLLLWPVGLSPLYNMPAVRQVGFENFYLPLLLLVLLAAVLVALLWWIRTQDEGHSRWRLAIFSCAWVVFLLPALNLPALPEEQIAQDRYIYLPSVALAVLLALVLEKAGRIQQARAAEKRAQPPRWLGIPSATAIPAALLVLLLAAATVEESHIWSSQATLFARAVRQAPHSKIARANYAAVLIDSGRYGEAIALLRKQLDEDPSDPVVRANLIAAMLKNGQMAAAEQMLAELCRNNPNAQQLYQLGFARLALQHPETAEEPLRRASEMSPTSPGFHLAYGAALQRQGKREAAAAEFRRELQVNPTDEQAHIGLAQLGEPDQPAFTSAPSAR